jgi:hypothetical protein
VAESEAELREIPASEILDKIQKGEPVEYDHVRVTGDLDTKKLNFLSGLSLGILMIKIAYKIFPIIWNPGILPNTKIMKIIYNFGYC